MEDSSSLFFPGLRRVPASIVGFWPLLTFLGFFSSRLRRKNLLQIYIFIGRFPPQVDPVRTEETQLAAHFLPLRLQFSPSGRAVFLRGISEVREEREMTGAHQLDFLQYLIAQAVLVPAPVH